MNAQNVIRLFLITIVTATWISCKGGDEKRLYNGRIDVETIQIVARTSGTIDSLIVEEGQKINRGQLLVKIDDRRVRLRLQEQKARLQELESSRVALKAQMRQAASELKLARSTLRKTERMLKDGAATEQQLDEIATRVEVLQGKWEALQAQIEQLESKRRQLEALIASTRLSLEDCRLLSPINGTVIQKFVHVYEQAYPNRPLLEIADLSVMEAVIYVPLQDLPRIRLDQQAEVLVDGHSEPLKARVKWIADEAEFTPKTIMTRDNRSNLVYEVRLSVANVNEILKIGMPVDVRL